MSLVKLELTPEEVELLIRGGTTLRLDTYLKQVLNEHKRAVGSLPERTE